MLLKVFSLFLFLCFIRTEATETTKGRWDDASLKRRKIIKKFNFYSALKKYNYDKLEWEITPKERIYMKTPHKIFCGIKCSENDECGGFVFHEDTGTFDFIYKE